MAKNNANRHDLLHHQRRHKTLRVTATIYLKDTIRREHDFHKARRAHDPHTLGSIPILRERNSSGKERLYITMGSLSMSLPNSKLERYVDQVVVYGDIRATPQMRKGPYRIPGAEGTILTGLAELAGKKPDGNLWVDVKASTLEKAKTLLEEMKAGRLATVTA